MFDVSLHMVGFDLQEIQKICTLQGVGGSNFPYILLNEIQTMFSQLAKQSSRQLPAVL